MSSSVIETTLLIVTALSTFFAALAAWLSYLVSKNNLDFQKGYVKNQRLIQNLNRTITIATNIKTLIHQNPLEMEEKEYENIEPLLTELKSELLHLSNTGVIDYENLQLYSISSMYDLARNKSSLNEVVQNLEISLNNKFV
jgi:ribosomal protein S20